MDFLASHRSKKSPAVLTTKLSQGPESKRSHSESSSKQHLMKNRIALFSQMFGKTAKRIRLENPQKESAEGQTRRSAIESVPRLTAQGKIQGTRQLAAAGSS
jgi:two-component sensor histidine kinase